MFHCLSSFSENMNLCPFSVGRLSVREAPERTLNRTEFSHIYVIIYELLSRSYTMLRTFHNHITSATSGRLVSLRIE